MRAAKAATGARRPSRARLFRIKVISMGEQATGKSCLIKRYCEEKFVQKYIPTIGVDYGVKPVKMGEYEVRVNLWDLAGAADYLEVRNEFYKDAQGCVLVYDVTNRASFEALGRWLEEARQHGADNMTVFVAATKADVPKRMVLESEGREWAQAHGLTFFEVSAASAQNVGALFSTLFARVLATLPGVPQELSGAAVQAAKDVRQE